MSKILMIGLGVWLAIPLLGTVLWSLWSSCAPRIRWVLFHAVDPVPRAVGLGVVAGRFVELSKIGFVVGLVTVLGLFLLSSH